MPGTPRGRWDRSLSTEARRRAQRAAIVRATARALEEQGEIATVTHVIDLAGVGRNTFYEHFTDAHAAIDAVQREAAEALGRAVDDAAVMARTPVERLRAVSHAWLDAATSVPAARALLHAADRAGGPRAELRRHVERLLAAIVAEARAAGRASLPPDRARVAAAGGAFERLARAVADDPSLDRHEHAEVLVDVVLRAFR